MWFNKITCAGGVVVCHGIGCKVSFKDVTFIGCTLTVLEGASVTLTNTTFKFDTAYSQGLALFASGNDTKVLMHGGSITGGTQGATIQVCSVLSCLKHFASSHHIMLPGDWNVAQNAKFPLIYNCR
jgi:hypothetical protein